MKYKGKVVVITGASSGMGEGISKKFLEEGAIVYGCGRRPAINYSHENMHYVSVDITNYEECEKFIDLVSKETGTIDVLVNSAGITGEGNLEETSLDDFKLQFDINVNGTFNMCKTAIKYMKNKETSIINIASDLGAKPVPNRCAYAPAKAAVISLTQSIAIDYAPKVRANSILSGIVDTPMIAKRFESVENPEELRKIYESFYLSNRIGEIKDIVNAVMFLASENSSFITGESLSVCGGSLIK